MPAPNGRLKVEFSALTTIRELADGRVLLFDRREERLMVADFATGTVRDVARKGRGPAEFEFVAAQLVLPSNEHILGFGAQTVYVVETDNDGIQRLRRHPLYTSLRP